jgi:hypothetical protein
MREKKAGHFLHQCFDCLSQAEAEVVELAAALVEAGELSERKAEWLSIREEQLETVTLGINPIVTFEKQRLNMIGKLV